MNQKIPDIGECFRLMEQYEMLPNIRQHSLVVARVAELLIDTLKISPESSPQHTSPLYRDTVLAGALLHDIAKTQCLNDACDHAKRGAEICFELGFLSIGEIVQEHVTLKKHEPDRYRNGIFSAREIVYYADKRVRHDEIVSLKDRLSYIISAYGRNNPHIENLIHANFQKCVSLEEFIFLFIDFSPEELSDQVVNKKESVL